jgi:hypothetical protein
VLLPAALALLYVHAFGVSVVFSDSWSVVRLLDEWSSGTLQASDLFRPHNEHRMFFPKGVELLLAGITTYDNLVEMYVIQICFLVTMVILLLAFKDIVFRDNARPWWLFLFVPVSFLVFSFRQYENLLFGFQINFAFTQTFGVLALFLLYVLGHKRFVKFAFIAALVSATVASFSNAQGLLVWPAGFLQLFIGPLERPAKRSFIAVWGLIGLIECVTYFVDYESKGSSSLLYVLAHPIVGARYFLNLMGSSLFWHQDSAFVGGLLLTCLALVSLFLIHKDKRLGEYSFWVSLLLYSLLMLATITIGRSGIFPAVQALAPRYTSFSILAVVSVYAMLVKMVLERRSVIRTVLLVAVCGITLVSAVTSYSTGIEEGSKEKVSREKAAFVLYTYESQPDEALVESLNPRAKVVREHAPLLQRLGYNVFSEQQAPDLPPLLSGLSPVSSPTSSAVTITGPGIRKQNQSITVPKEGSFMRVSGWAVDANNESPAGGVYVDIDGSLFPAFYGMDTQDVADSFGVTSYRYSGFERAIPMSEIGPGTHELSIVVLTSGEEGYYQPDRKIALEVDAGGD